MTVHITSYTLFRVADLDEMLEHRLDRYDVAGIIKNATIINPHTGSRYWNVFGDELEELIWFHQYEVPVVFATSKVSRTRHYIDAEHSEASGITELIYEHSDAPMYVADDISDAAMVVKAAELTLLADDHFHLMLNHGYKSDNAQRVTIRTMFCALKTEGFKFAA